jgi:methionyl-tRNA formyltransferase
MFLEAIDGFANDTITLRHQPNDQSISLRCYPRIPMDGEIDWSKDALEIDRLIRAVSEPFTGAYTYIGTEKLMIWKGHFEIPEYPFVGVPGQVAERRKKTGEVAIVTGKGLMVLEEVSINSMERKKPTEVIKTIRTRLGMDITGEISRISQELERFNK